MEDIGSCSSFTKSSFVYRLLTCYLSLHSCTIMCTRMQLLVFVFFQVAMPLKKLQEAQKEKAETTMHVIIQPQPIASEGSLFFRFYAIIVTEKVSEQKITLTLFFFPVFSSCHHHRHFHCSAEQIKCMHTGQTEQKQHHLWLKKSESQEKLYHCCTQLSAEN